MTAMVNQIIICGWNRHTPMLLREVTAHGTRHARRVVVFADREPPPELPEWVTYVKGDPTQEVELAKVRLSVAEVVLVVADEKEDGTFSSADARTILTTFTIRAYEGKLAARGINRTRRLHVIAELLDPDNHGFLETAGADEIIETARFGSSLLARSTAAPRTGEVMAEFLGFEGAFLRREGVPDAYTLPMPFWELAAAIKRDRDRLPVGLRRAGKDWFNPPADTPVEPGDQLVSLSTLPLEPLVQRAESFWEPLQGGEER